MLAALPCQTSPNHPLWNDIRWIWPGTGGFQHPAFDRFGKEAVKMETRVLIVGRINALKGTTVWTRGQQNKRPPVIKE